MEEKFYFQLLREAAIINTTINNKKVIQEDDGDGEIKKRIIIFFTSNPKPNDEQIHQFAEENNLSPEKLEAVIYSLLGTLLGNVGKHKDIPDEKFDPEQLAMGIEVEKEHTDCPILSKEIAKDHLAELPDYYTRLKKMEEEGEAELKAKQSEPSLEEKCKVAEEATIDEGTTKNPRGQKRPRTGEGKGKGMPGGQRGGKHEEPCPAGGPGYGKGEGKGKGKVRKDVEECNKPGMK